MGRKKIIVLGFLLIMLLVFPVYAEWSFDIAIKKIADNSPDTQITYSDVVAGTDTWKVADQYIEIDSDCNLLGWGIQIYTDNKGTGSDPLYTGTEDNPGGLVGVSTTTMHIPLAFSVKGSTETVVAPNPWPGEESYANHCWKWMSDISKSDWVNDDFGVRVWDDEGIYWHDSPTEANNPVWDDSPNIIYLSAGFHDSIAQQYTTNKLILELYSLDDRLVYGIFSNKYKYASLKLDVLNPPDPDGGFLGLWIWPNEGNPDTDPQMALDNNEEDFFTDPPYCTKITFTAGANPDNDWGGIIFQFGYDGSLWGGISLETDMSDYSSAYLKFDVKSSDDKEIKVAVEWGAGSVEKGLKTDLSVNLSDGNWHSVEIELSSFTGIDFTKIKCPATFAVGGEGNVTFYIDNLRWEEY